MRRRILITFALVTGVLSSQAQEKTDTLVVMNGHEVPTISYTGIPKKYKIAGIDIKGTTNYEDFVLLGFAGLSIGDIVEVPGDEITEAVKRFWKQGLFSDVKVLATRMEGDKIWIEIQLTERPRISEIKFSGVKKGEREDLEAKLGLVKGNQITPNLINRAKKEIKKYFDNKGFSNATVQIVQKDDNANSGKVIVDVVINKNEKTKVHEIFINGNEALSGNDIRGVMKKTNEGFNLQKRFMPSIKEMFSSKKFVPEEYENDKQNIVNKYNEKGYRDAVITVDSVVPYNDKKVDIYLSVDEGNQYHLKDIQFVGNTKYPTEYLMAVLGMKPGDVYNQKKLDDRLTVDEDAVGNVYYNNGYIFFQADPVEVDVDKDSVALEIRIVEGPQATINRVMINGNDRLYEDIVRRELRTKPGQLFSKEDLMRSAREIAQMGHFDPETMDIKPLPDFENGTVDIQYNLTSKANDQIEFSAGWGATGVIGRLSLKFTNFSMNNLFNPKTYKGIIPQGEGQTLTVSGQTNGRYYQSYSLSFMDPWFGGKRPNTLSASAYFSYQTDISDRYYGSSYMNPYGGYYPGGGMYPGNNYYDPSYSFDPDKSIKMLGLSIGYGKRLSWPDDYFSFMLSLNYQLYMLKDWNYFIIQNGNCNNINLDLTVQRSSIDNPLYTRSGSEFTFSVSATPPYSLWDGVDYANMKDNDGSKQKWIEYHKWKFKGRVFTPLAPLSVKRTPVLMSRVEYGFVGHYDKNKRSPFETFYMGGDGMSGYSSTYATETIGLRGYENGSLTPWGQEGYAYSRLSMELRYPFLLEPTSTIYGLAFVEAGNAWADIKDFNPFQLKRSAGLGVRIFLPMIGMMGIDWAYGFDKIPGNPSANGSNFHFIIGQEF
ncbi:MAG: outer membrane protein assembly factor BamA [Tannerellaceae bacterium]